MTQTMTAAEYRKTYGLPPVQPKAKAGVQCRGRARMPKNGRNYDRDAMNRTEEQYAAHLDAQPDVLCWKYEAVKLRLAERTFYTPDFLVVRSDGSLELHEVKGHWEDDARVKIKVAAEQYPYFVFRAVRRVKGAWQVEDFRMCGEGR